MRSSLFVFLFGCLFVSCNKGPTQAEYDLLQSKYEDSSKTLKDIRNTPAKRLVTAKRHESNRELEKAEEEYESIIELYPNSDEADIARAFIAERERLNNLGFKALVEQEVISEKYLTLTFSDINIGNKWVFDRHDTRYISKKTKRGSKYITTTLSVKSDINEPLLLPILAYELKNGELKLIGPLKYEFYRWSSYGSYLGNYSDSSNDFAHSETVTFSLGLLIDDELANSRPIFLLTEKANNCIYRSYDRLNSPNTSYLSNRCRFKETLSFSEAFASYNTVKIFNKDKI